MNTQTFPEGLSYWNLNRNAEAACEEKSLANQNANLIDITTKLGTIVSLLYRMASCHYGCHGKEHILEYLAGRTCTSAHSAYRLIGFGYYDEALALSRNIAEIGNLVHLFFIDNSHIRLWLDLPDQKRKHAYRPAAVRAALKSLSSVVPTDQDQYSWLCEIGTHVNPKTLPQAHNDQHRPILGAVLQPDGCAVATQTLAWSVCTVAAPLAKLSLIEYEHAKRLLEESISLVEALPET